MKHPTFASIVQQPYEPTDEDLDLIKKRLEACQSSMSQCGTGLFQPDNIESPYMDQRRMIQERVEAGQRAIQSLFVWKIIGIIGWLAFGVVVMR